MKILLVEDEQVLLKSLELRLKKDGFEVIPAKDGREAMNQLQTAIPDLVVTDVMLPFRNGLEVVRETKLKHPHVPVIVLSGLGQEQHVMDGFKLGADDYVTKPFSPQELIVRIKRLLSKFN